MDPQPNKTVLLKDRKETTQIRYDIHVGRDQNGEDMHGNF